jgi:carbon-monoxide dehydrogenase large subunit
MIYHMSDRREAGNAAFPGPPALIEPFLADPFGQLVQGQASYVSDVVFPEALYLEIVRSPLASGSIKGIDSRQALARPGIHAILTASDLDEVPLIPIRVGSTPTLEGRRQPVLANEHVRYVGEPIAVVVADSHRMARDAADDVMVEIEPEDVSIGWGAGIRDSNEETLLVELESRMGDINDVLRTATEVVEVELATARRTGAPIEPRGLIAQWEGEELHLWGVTKFIHFTRRTIAGFFSIDPEMVVCHRVDVGGMFGVRGEVYPEDFLVPWAARKVGRPVRWDEHRRSHFLAINQSGEQHHRIRVAIDPAGSLLALDAEVIIDVGAYSRPIGGRIPHIVIESLPGPYRWGAFRVRCRSVATNKTPTGTIRGPGAFEATFARERAIDVAARRGGHDPLAVRLKSLLTPRDLPHRVPIGPPHGELILNGGNYPAVLTALLDQIRYNALIEERNARRAGGELVGIGLGPYVIHSGLGGTESVRLDLTAEGRFVIRTSAANVGQGLDRMARKVLADRLEVPGSSIDVWSGDSRAHSDGNGTFSSRSTVFVGNAILDAIKHLRNETRARAAQLLGCRPDQITYAPRGPCSDVGGLAWKDVGPVSVTGVFTMPEPTFGFGAHVAMVTVDGDTGEIRLERLAVGYDCGRAVDKEAVVDQLVGGAVMGIGGALYERLEFDDNAIPLSGTFGDYLLPRAGDVPPIQVMVAESAAPENPLGARGAGEAGVIGAGAAIANAVADALGAAGERVRRLPLRPEDVLVALAAGTGQ